VDADFGSAALGAVSSALRIEVWEDAKGTQHFLGQAHARPARISPRSTRAYARVEAALRAEQHARGVLSAAKRSIHTDMLTLRLGDDPAHIGALFIVLVPGFSPFEG
jgi:hypothetical protein